MGRTRCCSSHGARGLSTFGTLSSGASLARIAMEVVPPVLSWDVVAATYATHARDIWSSMTLTVGMHVREPDGALGHDPLQARERRPRRRRYALPWRSCSGSA